MLRSDNIYHSKAKKPKVEIAWNYILNKTLIEEGQYFYAAYPKPE